MFKYGVFSGPNTGKYGPEKKNVFGHLSHSVSVNVPVLYLENSWNWSRINIMYLRET